MRSTICAVVAAKRDPQGTASEWIELMPAGEFTTIDGRGPFYNDAPATLAATSALIAAMGGLPVDFDHAIDRAAPAGGAAPAAG
jgi:phage I-like protein